MFASRQQESAGPNTGVVAVVIMLFIAAAVLGYNRLHQSKAGTTPPAAVVDTTKR